MKAEPLDFRRLRVFPLAQRESLTRAEEILLAPESAPPPVSDANRRLIRLAAERLQAARERGVCAMLIYGAHLLRNGAALLLDLLMERGWLTHLATNGAGTIHDWEYAWLGASTESVERNVAAGTFGTWDETSRYIHLALMTGALDGLGYGQALGRFISEDGCTVPAADELARQIAAEPRHLLTSARADLLAALEAGLVTSGRLQIEHRWKHASILASAWRHGVGMTVHPGIGYDIISNHPIFSGSVLGRAAERDFKLFAGALAGGDGGVTLSVGSAVMGPQVFEKAMSCVNNLRVHAGGEVVRDHTIFVADLQDGGGWDWTQGEPPKTNPAYYLRFCKSYSRMGGPMHYLQCDNAAFTHHLLHALK